MAKRRANGEGNIRKRKDGRWVGCYPAGRDPETGRTIYRNVLGKTQAEVKEKLEQVIQENTEVDTLRAEQYTVGQWMDVWYENYAKIKVRPSSHQTYKGYIENHIKPNIGSVPLSKLPSLQLQKLYKKLLSKGRVDRVEAKGQPKGLSPKTVRNINQVISSAMDFTKSQKLIAVNPTDGCALPKLEHQEMKTLSVEQLTSPDTSPYGSSYGSKNDLKNKPPKKVQKSKNNPLISKEIRGFLVAGTGLEPATSGL